MKTELQQTDIAAQCRDLAVHYREMVQNCTDAIKFLSGDIPDGLRISFSVNDKVTVLAFPIAEEDESFCVGFFMSWHEYYTRKLAAIEMQLRASELVAPSF